MAPNRNNTYHHQVRAFLRSEISDNFELNAYHREILRVVAEYCDLPLGYCCLKQINLMKECGMQERHLRNCLNDLITHELIHRVFKGKLSILRIGQVITGVSNDIID